MTCKTGQMSARPCVRCQQFQNPNGPRPLAEWPGRRRAETWHIYSTGRVTIPLGSRILSFGPFAPRYHSEHSAVGSLFINVCCSRKNISNGSIVIALTNMQIHCTHKPTLLYNERRYVTYIVSSGTLNPTIPYHTFATLCCAGGKNLGCMGQLLGVGAVGVETSGEDPLSRKPHLLMIQDRTRRIIL